MPHILPPTRPRMSSAELLKLVAPMNHDWAKHPILVVGVPGYYGNFGARPGNERGIYDDAIFLVTASVFAAFNGNTDPSSYCKGKGTGAAKGMATLKAGYWPCYKFRKHKGQYLALCQDAGKVTAIRDGDPPYEDTGYFGINIHRGSVNGTSSAGCQTIPPSQWDAFISLATSEAKRIYGSTWQKDAVVAYALLT